MSNHPRGSCVCACICAHVFMCHWQRWFTHLWNSSLTDKTTEHWSHLRKNKKINKIPLGLQHSLGGWVGVPAEGWEGAVKESWCSGIPFNESSRSQYNTIYFSDTTMWFTMLTRHGEIYISKWANSHVIVRWSWNYWGNLSWIQSSGQHFLELCSELIPVGLEVMLRTSKLLKTPTTGLSAFCETSTLGFQSESW